MLFAIYAMSRSPSPKFAESCPIVESVKVFRIVVKLFLPICCIFFFFFMLLVVVVVVVRIMGYDLLFIF